MKFLVTIAQIIIVAALLAVVITGIQARALAQGKSQAFISMPGTVQMPSSVDLAAAMSQEGSGTSWLPASTPVYGSMLMRPNGDMLMAHGAVMPRYTYVGSKRGDRRADAPNWFMGMYSHPINSQSQLSAHLMMSLDPLTEGGWGYPLLFQTGETWHGQPLHDRQHPHDLFDEVSATYSHLVGSGNSVYLYAADPGEPALGPPTYMHRLLALDYPDAPIGHHWQDATHITFGVVTTGFNLGSKIKIEGSKFTGREPDENRYNFDKPRWDSYSGRVSFNPNSDNAFQISYGFIKDPEGDGANVDRTTASWLYNRPLGYDANFTTALVWGQNFLTSEGKSESYLAEADYQNGANTYFTRLENIQKSGIELVLPDPFDNADLYDLTAVTVGYVRDLTHGKGIDTGLGFAVTADSAPAVLDPFYGSGPHLGFEVYLRLRASRMGLRHQPAMPMPTSPAAASPAALSIQAAISPDPPKAGDKNALTVTVAGADGKGIAGAKVEAAVSMTSMDMGTSHPAFTDIGNGRYQADVSFAMPGTWQVAVTVTPSGGSNSVTKVLDYTVGR